ncbi:MAG: phytanoyl-CoA dioxygenase family protein [Armatimonadetes bacterium]|nr:phytanoyl-CoA dioxygenase family protein [Armatimonadota bacterium]
MATSEGSLTREQVSEYRQSGFLILRGFFTPEEVLEIRDVFMAQAAEGVVPSLSDVIPNLPPDDPLSRYPRMLHPHRHLNLPVGAVSLRYLLDPRIEGVLCTLLEDEPIAAQTMFYFKPPGARGQALHQDNFYLRVKPGVCLGAWLALDDATPENGGIVVVPESHRLDIICPTSADLTRSFVTDRVIVPKEYVELPLHLHSGDMLFFHGNLIHGSYPNESRTLFRRAFICHYIPRRSLEVSHWFNPFYTFQGTQVSVQEAEGGGPCGVVQTRTEAWNG